MNISNSKVSLFQVEDKGKWVKANISEGIKDKDGNWTNMYWNGMFLGSSADIVRGCEDKTKINITSGRVENTYDKETKKGYVNVKVFECELVDVQPQPKQSAQQLADDDDLPF